MGETETRRKREREKRENGGREEITDSPTCPVGSRRLSFGVHRFTDSLWGKAWRQINRPIVSLQKYRVFIILVVAIILFVLMAMIIALGISSIVSEAAEKPTKLKALSPYPNIISESEQQIESMVNEVPVTNILFYSPDPANKIIGFYKNRMSRKGWGVIYPVDKNQLKEKGIDISKIPDIDPEKGSFLALKKGDITYYIAAMKFPQSIPIITPSPKKGATAVYIKRVTGKISYKSPTKDVPGKELANVSRYPKTVRKSYIELDQGRGGISLIYESKDSPEKIVGFYQKDMAQRGWRGMLLPQSEKTDVRLIFFQSKKGESCLVSVMSSGETSSSKIVILYQERGF